MLDGAIMKRRDFLKGFGLAVLAPVAALTHPETGASEKAPNPVELAKKAMRNTITASPAKRGLWNDIYISPEGLRDMRNWRVDQIDDGTRREILLANGLVSMSSVVINLGKPNRNDDILMPPIAILDNRKVLLGTFDV